MPISIRRTFRCGLLALALILTACSSGGSVRPFSTSTTDSSSTTTTTTITTTIPTTSPPTPTTVAQAIAPRSTVATEPTPVAVQRSGCPPDPGIPGVTYTCGAGAAAGHRGQTCINHPPECPVGTASIGVDPTRGDAYCALANEVDNYAHGGAQRDINGDCPLAHTGPDITLVLDIAVIVMLGAVVVLLAVLVLRSHQHQHNKE